jgi:hypothetical protein
MNKDDMLNEQAEAIDADSVISEQVEIAEGDSALNEKVETAIEKYWPKIQKVIREKIAPSLLAALQNDEMLKTVLTPIHEALPFAVRLVVKKEAFFKFCFKHRDKLICKDAKETNNE